MLDLSEPSTTVTLKPLPDGKMTVAWPGTELPTESTALKLNLYCPGAPEAANEPSLFALTVSPASTTAIELGSMESGRLALCVAPSSSPGAFNVNACATAEWYVQLVGD